MAALSVGGGARYGLLNVAFYLVFIPGLLLWLTCGVLGNARTLWQLKQRRI